MPIRMTTRAVAECDTCGGQLDPVEQDGISWPGDVKQAAILDALKAGWRADFGGAVYCPDHAENGAGQ